jgi:hypothetical protein
MKKQVTYFILAVLLLMIVPGAVSWEIPMIPLRGRNPEL